MASITLVDASVEIPVYNARGRSLKTTLIRTVGGQVESNDRDVYTIKALRNVTLSLRPGDRLGIVGHNGAGKSTLLRVFSGAYEPSSGSAEVSGTTSSLLDITMGMDFELTGSENIIIRGVLLGMSIDEAKRRIPEIAEFSELGDYLDLPMRTYSSGMVLRLAFAISTTQFPDILLLDEMISVGDAAFAARARQRIEDMMGKASILVLASHDTKTLVQYCNRAILLKEGMIAAEGSVGSVLRHYGVPEERPEAPKADARDVELVRQSGLFDAAWYLERYPELELGELDPLEHYLLRGCVEGRAAGPDFDCRWYLATYPDVAASEQNPLVHFIKFGAAEGRRGKPEAAPLPEAPGQELVGQAPGGEESGSQESGSQASAGKA